MAALLALAGCQMRFPMDLRCFGGLADPRPTEFFIAARALRSRAARRRAARRERTVDFSRRSRRRGCEVPRPSCSNGSKSDNTAPSSTRHAVIRSAVLDDPRHATNNHERVTDLKSLAVTVRSAKSPVRAGQNLRMRAPRARSGRPSRGPVRRAGARRDRTWPRWPDRAWR